MPARSHADDLIDFVAASPSSYHAAAEVARRLDEAGFVQQDERAAWDSTPGGHYVVRDGSLVAWRVPAAVDVLTGFRIVGSHTDSPTFKLKPAPDLRRSGWQQIGLEVYGGPLLNSWLDRELGLAGRVVDRCGTVHLVRTGAIMRIPQLAIHLDRGVNDEGVKLDKQLHTQPIWGAADDLDVLDHLATAAGLRGADAVAGHDVVAFDTARGGYFGAEDQFLACGRLDNLSSVHAGVVALLAADDHGRIPVLAAFDHEEIGSGSRSGASGPILADVLHRIAVGLGADADGYHRALAASVCVSSDAGHAVHPNYPQRHDPANHPLANGGPLLKINANQRYATDAVGAAAWTAACAGVGVSVQPFVSNNQIPCGSTIGPLTATLLGVTTVDVGVPLLSMHSAREMCGVEDPYALSRALGSFMAE
jgi:aspartyl aminopeptidase